MHRFVDDLPYGHLLRRFRNGELTIEDIKKLNERVYKGGGLPDGMQYASYRNRDRDIINASVFLKFCLDNQRDGIAQDAVAILMDDLKVKNGNNTSVPMRSQNRFFQNCMEDNLSCGSGDSTERLAPILYGMKDGPFMITYNKDVKQGQANGSCVFLEKVMLKAGESYSYITHDNSSSKSNKIPITSPWKWQSTTPAIQNGTQALYVQGKNASSYILVGRRTGKR